MYNTFQRGDWGRFHVSYRWYYLPQGGVITWPKVMYLNSNRMKHYYKSLDTDKNYGARLVSFPTLQSLSPTSQSPPALSHSFILASWQVAPRSSGRGSLSQLD